MPYLKKDEKVWNSGEKIQARYDTVIQPFKEMFKRDSIPDGFQYWTLGGQCETKGELLEDCELDQMRKTGLVKDGQFFSVDGDDDIVLANRKVAPDAHWFYGDFLEIMNYQSDFKPILVNADMTCMADNGVRYLACIIHMLSNLGHPLMLVGNMVRKYTHVREIEDVDVELRGVFEDDSNFISSWNTGKWGWDGRIYTYYGDLKRTEMVTLVFQKHK